MMPQLLINFTVCLVVMCQLFLICCPHVKNSSILTKKVCVRSTFNTISVYQYQYYTRSTQGKKEKPTSQHCSPRADLSQLHS
uniref:Uncharacterized protein n=1 Tax=Rhipicephalus appendiculatus TaxID=34631 RepID=A0A131YE03_RHIAP